MKLTFLTALLLALTLSLTATVKAAQPPLANTVVVIVRHAEKPDDGSGLTPAGQQRANAYVGYFRHFHIDSKLRVPDDLIATADTNHSQRPRLTLEPLSAALKLPIDDRFRTKEVDALAEELQTRPHGKTILICWHHEKIPALLQALGADPGALLPGGEWPDNVYNWVLVLRYDAHGHLIPGRAARINERLMPGDAS